MDLHRAGSKPDWELVPQAQHNFWQRLAWRTNGLVTPGNFLSVLGAFLVLVGLGRLLSGQAWLGVGLIGFGRMFDAIDGLVASRTGTKSQFGASLDAGLDKILALLTLLIFITNGVMPEWLALLIAAQNIANVIAVFIGKSHGVVVPASRLGKNATTGYWVGLLSFLVAYLEPAFAGVLLPIAYIASLPALAMGILATEGYFEEAFFGISLPLPEARFKRYVIIRNPISSDSHKAGERIQSLREYQPDSIFTILDTVEGGREANAAVLREQADLLGPDTLLCIAAGDGTIHMVLNILLHDTSLPDEARLTPILPFWCGNANDLAYMLNGPWSRRKLRQALLRGAVVPIKPIETTFTYKDGSTETHIASSYASFGASAYVSYELEHALPRRSRLRRFVLSRISQEWVAALRALMQAPTFRITSHDRLRKIYERTYLNGSRFAKVIGIPLRLTDEKFHRVTIERKHPAAVAFHLLGLMNNKEIPKRAITQDEFTVLDDVWAQFDGEPARIAKDTRVTISLSQRAFYALSVRLSKKP